MGNVGSGFAQGLSAVMSQGLPVILNQRMQEQKLKQDEEELKLRKQAFEAQSKHMAMQAEKSLREMMTHELVASLMGEATDAMTPRAEMPPVHEGMDPANAPQVVDQARLQNVKGRLAQAFALSGDPKQALALRPELTEVPPDVLQRRMAPLLGLFQQMTGQQPGAPAAESSGAPAAMPSMPTPAGQPPVPSTGQPSMPPQAPGVPRMQFVPTLNFDKNGQPSISIAGQLKAFTVNHFDITDADGNVTKWEHVFDPNTGTTLSRAPISASVPPEYMRKAMTQVRAVLPSAPREIQARAAGVLVGLSGDNQAQYLAGLEALEESKGWLPSGPGSAAAGPASSVPSAAAAGTVTGAIQSAQKQAVATAAAKTAAETRARAENAPMEAADRDKYRFLISIYDQSETLRQTFKPEFVGKGSWFSDQFRKEFNAQLAKAEANQYAPGALAGWAREFVGSASPEEANFRRTLVDVADQFLRMRSGAATTDREVERLKGAMMRLWDEPGVFLARLTGFQNATAEQIDTLKSAATKPAGSLPGRKTRPLNEGAAPKPSKREMEYPRYYREVPDAGSR